MPLSDLVLIAAAIHAAELDPSRAPDRARFARMLGISERAIRNWRNGQAISPEYRRWLERWVELDDATRRLIVTALAG